MKKWNSIKIIKYLGKSSNGLIRQKKIFKKRIVINSFNIQLKYNDKE